MNNKAKNEEIEEVEEISNETAILRVLCKLNEMLEEYQDFYRVSNSIKRCMNELAIHIKFTIID